MRRRLAAWYFTPMPAARLATSRMLVGGWSLVYLHRRRRMLRALARGRRREFRPVGPVRVVRRPLPVPVVQAAVAATCFTSAAVAVGWRHRLTGPLHAALLLAVLSYRNSWGMIFHNDNLLVLHAGVIALAPAADARSLDARRRETPAGASWRYGWPVQLLSATTVATYFVAGVAKVKGPLGWGWASGASLRSQVLADGLRKELLGDGASSLAHRLHDADRLWGAMAAGSLAVELGAPVALVSRRLGRLWAVAAWGMHVGIKVIMGITFRYQLSGIAFSSFVDVERIRVGRPMVATAS